MARVKRGMTDHFKHKKVFLSENVSHIMLSNG